MRHIRYQIPARPLPNSAPHPSRFKVNVNRSELAKLLVKELLRYGVDLDLVLSRPCVYGVFSGPLGGFMPREQHCVGCLRCTVQHPDVVQILPNPERLEHGDSYFDPDMVDTVLYEASTGRVPVRGAGYGGGFGGSGWDTMWTDMSEIVRPTRDGIHGREYISTSVHIGPRPMMLEFDEGGKLTDVAPEPIELPIPILFDVLPVRAASMYGAVVEAAEVLQTRAVVPFGNIGELGERSLSVVPLVAVEDVDQFMAGDQRYEMVELDGWEPTAYQRMIEAWPESVIAIRLKMGSDTVPALEAGASTFHMVSDYHGRSEGRFALEHIRTLHEELVSEGLREQVTLLGSGGIVAAEHVPKAIIAGLDLVAIETAVLIAWQAKFLGELRSPQSASIQLPALDPEWATQRVINLMASWRDQLLEILGAMGLREVRRLRGEIGRAMFQSEMENEAFEGIRGHPPDG